MEMNLQIRMMQQQDDYFCYIYVRVRQITYVGYAQIILGLILLAYAIRHFKMSKDITILPKNMKLIYLFVFAQITFYLTQMTLCLVGYWIYHDKQQDNSTFEQLSYFSKFIFAFDVIEVFTLQGLIILICYNWMQRVIILLEKIALIQSQYQNFTMRMLSFQMICRKIIRAYLIFRFVLYSGLLIFILISSQNPVKFHLYLIFCFLLAEAFITPIFLIISIYALLKNNKIKEIVQDGEVRRLTVQYSILLICTLIRFGFGLLEVLFSRDSDYNVKCTMDFQLTQNQLAYKIFMYMIEYIFQYYLPVLMVLRIYDLRPQYKISDSLLITQNTPDSARFSQ